MKKIIFTLFLAIMVTVTLQAQQISVVSPGGATSLFRTLPDAIKSAIPGSVIYLPGGGFSIPDSVKITKKLTIIGIGHYAKNGNVDGVTNISGNLYFNQGSSGSSVMGCYITGRIYIGSDKSSVNDILIRYCNVYSINIKSNICLGTVVSQNYLRHGFNSETSDSSAPVEITNNVVYYISKVNGGFIANNIITFSNSNVDALHSISNSVINGNIIFPINNIGGTDISNSKLGNMGFGQISNDEEFINMRNIVRDSVFVNYNGGAISPASNFHFKDAYKQYENQVGVYAGGVDFDKQLAPVPYIVAKRVDEQTDASGKLNIKIRVKAGE